MSWIVVTRLKPAGMEEKTELGRGLVVIERVFTLNVTPPTDIVDSNVIPFMAFKVAGNPNEPDRRSSGKSVATHSDMDALLPFIREPVTVSKKRRALCPQMILYSFVGCTVSERSWELSAFGTGFHASVKYVLSCQLMTIRL
jgi:hypothetical protein